MVVVCMCRFLMTKVPPRVCRHPFARALGCSRLTKFLAAALIALVPSTTIGQQAGPLSSHAAAIQQRVSKLAPQTHISVFPFQAPVLFGNFLSSDPRGFSFYDIDRRTTVTLGYDQVRKIRNGYRDAKSGARRRTSSRVVVAVVVAALAGLIAAAAMARN